MATDVGAIYRSSDTVKDATGALVTPSGSTCIVTLPDQTTTTLTVVPDGTGLLHADYTMIQEGLHKFVWSTTGPVTSKTDYENATIYRSIVGLGEVRSYLNLVDTSRDEVLRTVMAAATKECEKVVGTLVIRTFTDDHIPGTTKTVLRLPHGPCPSRSSLTSISSEFPGGPTWAGTDLILYPDSGVVETANKWMGFWYGPWKATYTAGRLVIPSNVLLACKEIIYDLWSNQRGLLADPLAPDMHDSAGMEAAIPNNYTIPAVARGLLHAHSMPGFA